MTEKVSAAVANVQWGQRARVVDVRSATEFQSGHVAGAYNIPLEELGTRIGDLDQDEPVLLVCQAGQRAEIAAKCLAVCGIRGVVLDGGTEGWREAGLELVATTRARWSLERQVRLAAGLLVVTGVTLAATVSDGWIYLAGFVGLGLTMAGLTGFCPMAKLLAALSWNKNKKAVAPPAA